MKLTARTNGEYCFRDALPADAPAVREIVFAVLREYGLSSDRKTIDADLDDLAASYAGRGGCFLVVVSPAGKVAGCGGLYPLDEAEAEIRKMYLLPEARGRGLGRRMLHELIRTARARGFRAVTVETATVLKEAISLYRSSGFVPTTREQMTSRCDQAYVLRL